jgi:hypothetical protein
LSRESFEGFAVNALVARGAIHAMSAFFGHVAVIAP